MKITTSSLNNYIKTEISKWKERASDWTKKHPYATRAGALALSIGVLSLCLGNCACKSSPPNTNFEANPLSVSKDNQFIKRVIKKASQSLKLDKNPRLDLFKTSEQFTCANNFFSSVSNTHTAQLQNHEPQSNEHTIGENQTSVPTCNESNTCLMKISENDQKSGEAKNDNLSTAKRNDLPQSQGYLLGMIGIGTLAKRIFNSLSKLLFGNPFKPSGRDSYNPDDTNDRDWGLNIFVSDLMDFPNSSLRPLKYEYITPPKEKNRGKKKNNDNSNSILEDRVSLELESITNRSESDDSIETMNLDEIFDLTDIMKFNVLNWHNQVIINDIRQELGPRITVLNSYLIENSHKSSDSKENTNYNTENSEEIDNINSCDLYQSPRKNSNEHYSIRQCSSSNNPLDPYIINNQNYSEKFEKNNPNEDSSVNIEDSNFFPKKAPSNNEEQNPYTKKTKEITESLSKKALNEIHSRKSSADRKTVYYIEISDSPLWTDSEYNIEISESPLWTDYEEDDELFSKNASNKPNTQNNSSDSNVKTNNSITMVRENYNPLFGNLNDSITSSQNMPNETNLDVSLNNDFDKKTTRENKTNKSRKNTPATKIPTLFQRKIKTNEGEKDPKTRIPRYRKWKIQNTPEHKNQISGLKYKSYRTDSAKKKETKLNNFNF